MKALTRKERDALFMFCNGNCAYCGHPLPPKGWHADHVEPIIRKIEYVKGKDGYYRGRMTGGCHAPQNHRKDNYLPACRACNIHKSSSSLEAWRSQLQQSARILRDNYSTFRHAERFGLVAIVDIKIIFYFERMETA